MTPPAAADTVALGLFERHGGAIRRFLYRLTRDPAAADDLAAEVFLRVVKASATYEPREREAAWVFRIAQNVLRDTQRRQARSVEQGLQADAASPADQVAGLDLQRGLDALPPEERVALLLGEVAGLSYAEIAEATGSTVAAVRSRLYRARQTLRERLLPPRREAPMFLRGSDDD